MQRTRLYLIVVALAGLSLRQPALAQAAPAVAPALPQLPQAIAESRPPLTRFDLDFAGGTPGDLVKAIEKATGKPLNVVIPIGSEDTPIPPLKMRSVTVPELFIALQMASEQTARQQTRVYTKREKLLGGNMAGPAYSRMEYLRYTFQTADRPPRDDSVWFFSSNATEQPKACRFWQLGPYLETYTVDDITTAIETGYKMLGDSAPQINFHKDTKLLIAVGDEGKLALIDAVLQRLEPKEPAPAPQAQAKKETSKADAAPKSAETRPY